MVNLMFMANGWVFPGCDLMRSAKRRLALLAIPIGLFMSLFHTSPCHLAQAAEPQLEVARVEKMPRVPEPLHLIDWKKTAREYYTVSLNPELKGPGLPAVNLSGDHKHFGSGSYLVAQRRRDPSGEAHACLIPVVVRNSGRAEASSLTSNVRSHTEHLHAILRSFSYAKMEKCPSPLLAFPPFGFSQGFIAPEEKERPLHF